MAERQFHFIAGLPRSGSTLLSAILSQNPRIHAAMSSPVGGIINAALSSMGAENEFAVFISDQQKQRVLKAIFDAYYADAAEDGVVLDTNRSWTGRLPALRKLYPNSKIICCVRNPAWVLDSVERLTRKNALDVSKIFNNAGERATVYSRADALLGSHRMIGFALASTSEAYFGADAAAMLLVDYDTLASRPEEVIGLVYQFLEEEPFEHDFNNVEYEAEIFDNLMLAKGLHKVSGKVELVPRRTILPPDLFERFSKLAFWNGPANTLAHRIIEAGDQR